MIRKLSSSLISLSLTRQSKQHLIINLSMVVSIEEDKNKTKITYLSSRKPDTVDIPFEQVCKALAENRYPMSLDRVQ